MTIDDDNSVYVGGLPYDATEDSVRRVFDLYGQVVAVKIINDHAVGGKCYGFVTFTNPRSAVDAITDMDGRTIDGRVVKVNEVKIRGMKSNFGRDSFRRNNERGMESGRGRERERNFDYDRERSRDQNSESGMESGRGRERERNYDYDRERSRDRNSERSRDQDQDRERGSDRARDLDRTRNRFIDRDRGRDQDRDMEDHEYDERERNHGQELGNDLNLDQDHGREIRRTKNRQRSGNNNKDQTSKLVNSSSFNYHNSKEHPSGSSQGDHNQLVEEQLDFANQKLAELQKEISDMTELAEERRHHISKLQEKSLKLEDTLTAAKKLTSHRQKHLTKLHKCFVTMKEYSGRLKSCEQELQDLVQSTTAELAYRNDVDVEGILTNGET